LEAPAVGFHDITLMPFALLLLLNILLSNNILSLCL